MFKILLIGRDMTGKSSIMINFCNEPFNPIYISTIGIDFKIKVMECMKKKIKLQIWDTAGQERFRTITTSYYRGGNLVVIVADPTDDRKESIQEELNVWNEETSKYARDPIVVHVINKIDLVSECENE